MAFLAIPAIPVISAEVAAWIGIGATAATAGAGAAIYSNSRKAEEAQTKPLARTDAATQNKKCKECPPESGRIVERRWNMSETSRAYQARVTGFASYTEWAYKGIDFDGFQSAQCLLQEAKARYAQFFDEEDDAPKFFFRLNGYKKLVAQARFQNAVTVSSPPAKLNWYFIEDFVCKHMRGVFNENRLMINTIFMP
ncbi:restriction endonuclease fold toxin 5 domain-containing protein [Herbaspirillum robiniae]|uniref:restriction endonuclease fold toxin 5 domain-containing protein n=1 Tax=Herbaspirillum robiniae TaxID=2014887 RepID=UPI003D76FCBE